MSWGLDLSLKRRSHIQSTELVIHQVCSRGSSLRKPLVLREKLNVDYISMKSSIHALSPTDLHFSVKSPKPHDSLGLVDPGNHEWSFEELSLLDSSSERRFFQVLLKKSLLSTLVLSIEIIHTICNLGILSFPHSNWDNLTLQPQLQILRFLWKIKD